VLASRETQIFTLVAEGPTNREIRHRLNSAEKTIMHHTANVLGRLHVRGRLEAAGCLWGAAGLASEAVRAHVLPGTSRTATSRRIPVDADAQERNFICAALPLVRSRIVLAFQRLALGPQIQPAMLVSGPAAPLGPLGCR
jgi:hypothetical protein